MLFAKLIQESSVIYYSITTFFTLNQIVFLFFLYAFLGWILEFTYRSVTRTKLVNPGFLKGPYVPLYGFAGLLLHVVMIFTWDEPVLLRLLIYFTTITVMEFITGEVLWRTFKKRWWDYSQESFNLRGHICLKFSLIWSVLALVFEETLYFLAFSILSVSNDAHLFAINFFALSLFHFDLLLSSGLLDQARKIRGKRVYFPKIKDRQFWQKMLGNSVGLLAITTRLKQSSKRTIAKYDYRKQKK